MKDSPPGSDCLSRSRDTVKFLVILAWITHEDSASRVNLAKQVGQLSEKRGPPRAEEDGPRCDARFPLASNRHTAILRKVPKKCYGTVYVAFR